VLLVSGDQSGVTLGREVLGKIERTAHHTGHAIRSSP
jgi:hypothetical protein